MKTRPTISPFSLDRQARGPYNWKWRQHFPNRLMRLRTVAAALGLSALLGVSAPATTPLMPVDEIRPGMVGVGRTVFEGTELQDFKAHILGVLRNVQGPRRDLILAKLEGGRSAESGVAQGMSGSPVYIDGRLIGAVSYSIGAFPKEADCGHYPDRRDEGRHGDDPRGRRRSRPASSFRSRARV